MRARGCAFLRGGWSRRPLANVWAGPAHACRASLHSAAHRCGDVHVGDLICAVDGRDVAALSDEAVAELLRGQPATLLTLSLKRAPQLGMSDQDIEAANAWAKRSGRMQAQHAPDLQKLLRLLQAVSIQPAQVPNSALICTICTTPCICICRGSLG